MVRNIANLPAPNDDNVEQRPISSFIAPGTTATTHILQFNQETVPEKVARENNITGNVIMT